MTIQNKTLFISGGTGSLGRRVIEMALNLNPKKVISYSRHEPAIIEMQRTMKDPDHIIRWIVGDVRDRGSLWRALNGVDFTIHTAALKNLETTEYSPFECVKTNVYGTQNILDVAIDRNVKKVLVVSSDKACSPHNLYGATKLVSEKLALAANVYAPHDGTRISVVRMGNYVRSNGNVVRLFENLKKEGDNLIPITDVRCTRFFIRLDDAAEFTLECLEKMKGGEIFCPDMPSVRITDIAKVVHPEAKWYQTGLRQGEKTHEIIEKPNGIRCSSSECQIPYTQVKELLE